jgi:hypothetical protein
MGRNELCRCGSGRKNKRCCGVRRGPSDADLAKAFLSSASGVAARRLIWLSTAELRDLFDEMIDLPARHLSLQMPLPRLSSPDLDVLRAAVDVQDADAAYEYLDTVLALLDTPERRAPLARAALALAESGEIDDDLADTVVVDLGSASTAFMRSSLLHAVAVSVGAHRTPSGLLVASR